MDVGKQQQILGAREWKRQWGILDRDAIHEIVMAANMLERRTKDLRVLVNAEKKFVTVIWQVSTWAFYLRGTRLREQLEGYLWDILPTQTYAGEAYKFKVLLTNSKVSKLLGEGDDGVQEQIENQEESRPQIEQKENQEERGSEGRENPEDIPGSS